MSLLKTDVWREKQNCYLMKNLTRGLGIPRGPRQKKNEGFIFRRFGVNAFTTGNPFLATKLLGISIGRGLGALKGLRSPVAQKTT